MGSAQDVTREVPHRYSAKPMTRMQFLMLRSMEAGESVSVAYEEVSSLGVEHPDWDMFERRTYSAWLETV